MPAGVVGRTYHGSFCLNQRRIARAVALSRGAVQRAAGAGAGPDDANGYHGHRHDADAEPDHCDPGAALHQQRGAGQGPKASLILRS
jgi:hypothetical protein